MIAAIVVPAGARSIAMIRACLVSGRIAVFEDEGANRTRLALNQLLDRDGLISRLEGSFSGKVRPAKLSVPKLAAFTTGSAVIASERRLASVMQQHRKVAGLDMELFGFHRAVELSGQQIHAFSAKVVVDKANEAKGDELHEYGCVVSAAFVLEAMSDLLGRPR